MMNYVRSWLDVVTVLNSYPWRTPLRLNKGILPHPEAAGMTLSVGLPEGQRADYRLVLQSGVGLHVKDLGAHYEAHLDEVHPEQDFFEHLRQDAPNVYVGGAVAMGAAVGGLLGKTWQSALAGAVVAGVAGAFWAAQAAEDDDVRPRPST